MRGRKPTPTALKVITGNPGKRPLNRFEPKPEGDLAEPPDWMTDNQKAIWRKLMDEAPPGLLKKIDESIVTVWVTACDTFRQACTKLARTGILTKVPNSPIPIQSPYLPIMTKQGQIMMKAASEMGFTPTTRSRISVYSYAPSAHNPWDDIEGGAS